MVFGGECHTWISPVMGANVTEQFSPALLRVVRKLIETEGAVKVRSIVQATSLPQPVLDLTHRYVELCVAFRSSGTDA